MSGCCLQLQEVFSTYKKERVDSDKTMMEQNDKLQEQLSELHSKNAKISTQLEFVSKRQDKPIQTLVCSGLFVLSCWSLKKNDAYAVCSSLNVL